MNQPYPEWWQDTSPSLPQAVAPPATRPVPPSPPPPSPLPGPLSAAPQSVASADHGVAHGPSLEGRAALIVAGGGGLLTLLAFLVLPHLTLPLIGPVTLPSLIAFAARFGNGAYGLLWLIAAAAVVVTVLGLAVGTSATSRPGTRSVAAAIILAVSLAISVGYLLVPSVLAHHDDISAGTSAGRSAGRSAGTVSYGLGVGYYVGALGMTAAVIAALVALVAVRRAGRRRVR